jgi:transcription elongation factor Elf1
MTNQPDNLFSCPKCQARYKLVRVEGDDVDFEGQITCRSCGAPLQGREGKDILKYFLVAGRRPRWIDQKSL